jgi:multimeric flavodoxin WrbA
LGLFFRGINGTASVTDYGKRGKIHMGIDLLHEKVRVLGISASPRKDGNSQFMLDVALGSMEKEYGSLVEITSYSFKGKKFGPCLSCFKCTEEERLGQCSIKDDFDELRDSWLRANVIIYSVPVYHLSIPGQLKCFIDRLGNTIGRPFESASPRFLKVVGGIAQGTHFSAGQESAINFLIQHAVLKNCLFVSGDGWQSYLGACGWTVCDRDRNAIKNRLYENDRDAELAVTASSRERSA